MAELESQQTTAVFPGKPAPLGDANRAGAFSTPLAQTPRDSDDDRPVGGKCCRASRAEQVREEGGIWDAVDIARVACDGGKYIAVRF